MATWTSDEIDRIADTDELRLASLRVDDTLRRPTTMWVVRHGDDLYVRAVNGPTARWFQGTRDRHEAHIDVGGLEKDVSLVDADHAIDDEIDAAYRAKYHRYPPDIVGSVVTPQARATTTRLVPHQSAR
ncbi:DUF2255 family protein [Spiractinospora alimapuensis]|uniref:DUF2255 family protein n=1 Tax=Spiractinospora alimapuensis TaxID=2820884 RepID=UPI001F395203|nr:DUF2255 family protein [Spiractinospora alimapuensis]QVQ52212.1 DUF2255 family protein [Spiractinospora alimapuensis]